MNKSIGHLMVMAGGTGGHVFPALAVAEELRDNGARITWLGTRQGLEAKVVPANQIDIEWVSIEGLRGKGALSWLMAPFKLLSAIWQSMRVLRTVKPDCVLGMGGFVSGPGGLAAWLLRTPVLVHEQNAVSGLTNKYLAKLASRAMTGFPDVMGMPSTADWVGNPVRSKIEPVSESINDSASIKILVIGGSQGAHSFNVHLPRIFSTLIESTDATIEIWHQSGRERVESVEKAYLNVGLQIRCDEFIDDMATAYQWADLLVCRAGAMTIAECCAAALPSLLIPFPFSAGDHQTINAQFLVNHHAAKMLDNSDLTSNTAVEVLLDLVSDRLGLQNMGQAAYNLHKPNAVFDVANACKEYFNA